MAAQKPSGSFVHDYGALVGGCLFALLIFAGLIAGGFFVGCWLSSLSGGVQLVCLAAAITVYVTTFMVWAFWPDEEERCVWCRAQELHLLLLFLGISFGTPWYFFLLKARLHEDYLLAAWLGNAVAAFLVLVTASSGSRRVKVRYCREAITKFLADEHRGTLISLIDNTWTGGAFVTRCAVRPFTYCYSYIAKVTSAVGIEEEIHLLASGDLRTLFSPTVTIPEVITDPDILARCTGTMTIVDE